MIAISVVVLIGLITSLRVYQKCIAPFRAPVVVVDGTEISMGYFLKRTRIGPAWNRW